ncbi:MAG: UDP-4-amino-4,6-dideoxy-N-acetyl-beta-L-altrosamine transaminase [Bacillota bacterium]
MSELDYLPYAKQKIDEDDLNSVLEALCSEFLTTGPRVNQFENQLANRVGAKYAVAFSSGTAALHAAYFAAGVEAGDEVITSPITFAATANAAWYLGARPVFVDVDQQTININSSLVEAACTAKTKVIAPVDFAGQPADLYELKRIARKHRALIVEDAAHALGAGYDGKPIGSLADMTIFSFHPVKQITTGEGGAVVTGREDLYRKLLSFRNHGIVRDKELLNEYHGPWYYEMQHLGYNYRITDIQCALGSSQLRKLEAFLQKRRVLANAYDQQLKDVSEVHVPVKLSGRDPALHLYVIRLKGEEPPRREVFETLQARGIGVQVHYIPVYWHPYYQQQGYRKGQCPVAEDYYTRCISLPLFPDMTVEDIERVVTELKRALWKCYAKMRFSRDDRDRYGSVRHGLRHSKP